MAVLGVCITPPVTGTIVALLFAKLDDLLGTYVQALATMMPVTMLFSHLIVGSAVKMLFNNRIAPDRSPG